MKKLIVIAWTVALLGLIACNNPKQENGDSGPANVELKNTDGVYRLHVNGEPFYVNGAGMEFGRIDRLVEHGGNSFRTWRTDNGAQTGKEVLDKAYENNLMVLMGIEIGRERHGFDYNDADWVKEQYERVKKEVMELKDHPALLGWAIGNELNLHASNKKVWEAVNEISIMIHEIDPNHPTTTTFAGFSPENANDYKTFCTDLDFVCIQMYGDIINLQKHIKNAGYEGPYMVTEWGATGHWEMPTTEWGIAIEQTSTEKAESVRERWEKAIKVDTTNCLGSYIFLWGQKQERTPTWYGLFTEDGNEIAVTDVMHEAWTGAKPENVCPALDSIFLNNMGRFDNIYLKSKSNNLLQTYAHDADGDSLKMDIELLPDTPDAYSDGGDFEKRPKSILLKEGLDYATDFEFEAPEQEGAYRIFVYIKDGHRNVATANVPFYVGSPETMKNAKK